MHTVSTDFFSYTPKDRTFGSEISTLGMLLRNDNLPFIFKMKSTRTGKEVVFNYVSTEYDGEGDIMYYEYYAPAVKCYCKIFND